MGAKDPGFLHGINYFSYYYFYFKHHQTHQKEVKTPSGEASNPRILPYAIETMYDKIIQLKEHSSDAHKKVIANNDYYTKGASKSPDAQWPKFS